jgi:hypothetical protein
MFCFQLVCFVLRYLSLNEPPIPVQFTALQKESASNLQLTLDHPDAYTEEMWDSAIHSLLVAIFFRKPHTASKHADKDPLHIALILMNVNADDGGNFNRCSVIAGKLSGFLHIMRLVAVKEIRRQADERGDEEDAEFE